MSNDFFCTFKHDNKSYAVQVTLEGSLDSSDQKNIQQIIRNCLTNTTPPPLYSKIKATITTNAPGSISVSCNVNDSDTPITFSLTDGDVRTGEQSISVTSLKITRISEQVFQKREKTQPEIRASLLTYSITKIPVLSFFWDCFSCPLSHIIKFCNPAKIYDPVSLDSLSDPHGRFALEQALEEVSGLSNAPQPSINELSTDASATSSSKSSEELEFRIGLREVAKWREPGAKHNEIATTLSNAVLELKHTDSFLSIPGGFWKDKDTFEPILWSFRREANELLSISEVAYGSDPEGVARKYTNLDPNQIKILITNLLNLSLDEKELEQISMSQSIGLLARTKSPPKSLGTSTTMQEFKEGLYLKAGGKKCEITTKSRSKIRENPLKLIQETIRIQDPDAVFANKVLFSLSIMYSRLNKVLEATQEMSAKQKTAWLMTLQKDYESLKRQVEKSGGDLQPLTGYFDKLQNAISKNETLAENPLKKLDDVKTDPFKIGVNPDQIIRIDQATAKSTQRLTETDYKNLAILKTAFPSGEGTSLDLNPGIQALTALTSRVDTLVEEKQYDLAITLYRLVMPWIPEPPSNRQTPEGFWAKLETVEPTDITTRRERSDHIKAISDQLGKLSQFFWEAKFKTADLRLAPDEWIYMLNTESALHQLRGARFQVLNKMRLADKDHPLKFTLEEDCFFTVISECAFQDDDMYSAYLEELEEEAYLRPSENPEIARKQQKNIQYLKSFLPQPPFVGRPIFTKQASEIAICEEILSNVKHRPEFANKTLSAKELWKHYLHRDAEYEGISVPTQFGDLSRHQLMFSSMLHPETSIARYIVTFRGVGKVIGNLGQRLYQEIDPKKQAKKNFTESLRVLGDHRVEIIPMEHMGMVVNWGIVPKGTSPGTIPDISITPGGLTDMQAGTAGIEATLGDHSEVLGKPNPDIFGNTFDPEKQDDYSFYDDVPSALSLLQTSLAKENSDPLATYALQALKAKKYSRFDRAPTIPESKNIHEVFDLILQSPSLLDKVFKNAENKDSFEAQKRMYEVLFSPEDLTKSIQDNPEFFLSHASPIKELLEKCIQEKKTERYLFLLYLTHTVFSHMDLFAQKDKDNLLANWPSMNTVSSTGESFLSHAMTLIKEERNFVTQVDGAAYIVSLFSNSIGSHKPEEMPPLSPDVIANILKLGGLLKLSGHIATMPIIADQASRWIKEYLAPYINDPMMNLTTRNSILDQWVEDQHGSIEAGDWKSIPGQPMFWSKKGTVIDLGTLQIIQYKGKDSTGIATTLPKEVVDHPHYQLLFNSKTFQATVVASKKLGEFLYTFRDDDDNEYQLLFNPSSRDIVIERRIKGETEEKWFQFYLPEMPKNKIPGSVDDKAGAGIERRLRSSGVWVNPQNKKEGVAFLGIETQSHPLNRRFNIRFDSYGKILSVKSPEYKDKKVAHEYGHEMSEALSCLPEDQLVFLRAEKSRKITDILFLRQSIHLSRDESNNTWSLHGDDMLEGAKWVIGKDRGILANKLLKSLGVSIENIGFTVRQDNQTVLLLWPQKISSEKQAYSIPPLKIFIKDTGEIVSSAAGYLELAYLFAAKHDYVKAGIYLEKARTAKIETKEEISLILDIERHFKELPASSARSARIKLKGLLSIRHIVQEQTKRPQFISEKWTDFLTEVQEINTVFHIYQTHLERTPFESKKTYYNRTDIDISFNADEITELSHISQEAFDFALNAAPTRTEKQVLLPVPTEADITFIMPWLVASQLEPVKDTNDLIQNLYLNESDVIGHFFQLYDLIDQKKLKFENLQMLFAPIPEIQGMDLETLKKMTSGFSSPENIGLYTKKEEALVYIKALQLDMARRLLLEKAARKAPSSEEESSSNALPILGKAQAIKKLLPGGPLSAAYQRIRGDSSELDTKLTELVSSVTAEITKDQMISLDGFAKVAPSDASAPKDLLMQLKEKKTINLAKFKNALSKDPNLFGSHITPILNTLLLNESLEEQLQAVDGIIPVDTLISFVEDKLQINLLEVLRENELNRRIKALEKTDTPPSLSWGEEGPTKFIDHFTLSTLRKSFSSIPEDNPEDQPPHITRLESELRSALKEESTSTKTKNSELISGLQNAGEIFRSKASERKTFPQDDLESFIARVEKEQKIAKKGFKAAETALLNYLLTSNSKLLPAKVTHAIKWEDSIGKEEVLNRVKKAYQTGELKDPKACHLVTSLLLEQTADRVLSGDVQKQLDLLKTLKDSGVPKNSLEWIDATNEVYKLSAKALNFARYLNTDGTMKSPNLYRKVLVMEAHRGIILTQDQFDLITQMVDTPESWYELKVGLGKTSVVLPLVLMLLIEKGEFPIAIVKDDLLQQNLDSLDRSTRELLERAGSEFSFTINDPTSPLILQESYYRILNVKKNKGYLITSISSVIAIDQKLQLLTEEFNKKSSIHLNPSLLTAILLDSTASLKEEQTNEWKMTLELDCLRKELYYLGKIRNELELLIIDEADDILHISCENNVGRGDAAPLNETIQTTMEHIMQVIHSSANPTLQKFNSCLQKGQQTSLSSSWVEEDLLPALVDAMLAAPEYNQYLGGLEGFDLTPLKAHILKVFDITEEESSLSLSEDTRRKLGALKRIIQSTFKVALKQNPGIDTGIKKSDGFQIGPQSGGQEKSGTVFGDEYDLVVNHYLFYGMRLPERFLDQKEGEGFIEKALLEMRERFPSIHGEWQEEAGEQDLITFLNQPENLSKRLKFLKLEIFNEKRLKIFERQIVINRQHICYGRRVGGMTGTLNSDLMPVIGPDRKKESAAKKVHGEVILGVEVLKTPTVTVVENSEERILTEMRTKASESNNKAIINQGFDLKKGDSKTVVADLRKTAPARIFVYVDSLDRTFYLWNPGEDQPIPISKAKLNDLYSTPDFKKQGCFYFGPPDIRGTDFRIPPGNGVAFLSSRCSMDEFIQAVGRMRKLGSTHSMDFCVESRSSISPSTPSLDSGAPTYAELINTIQRQDVEDQEGKVIKSVIEGMRSIVNNGTRNLLFNVKQETSPEFDPIRSLILQKLSSVAMDQETGWLEESKGVSLAADFERSCWEPTIENIEKIYQKEKDKIIRLREALASPPNEIAAALGIALSLSTSIPELLKASGSDSAIISEFMGSIDQMEKALDSAFERFRTISEGKDSIYPAQLQAKDPRIQHVQVQMQVQAQQQQQTQTQQQQKITFRPTDRHIKVSEYWFQPLFSLGHTKDCPPSLLDFFSNLTERLDIFLDVTVNFSSLFGILNGVKGNLSMCRILVNGDQLVLITQDDYHQIDRKKPILFDSIYSLTNQSACGTGIVLDIGKEPVFPEKLIKNLALAKFILGMSLDQYSQEELASLKEMQATINADPELAKQQKIFIEHFGSPSLESLGL